MRILGKVIAAFNRATELIVISMILILIIVVLLAVFFRYVLSDSLSWSEEVARYLSIWTGLLSASIVLRQRLHVGMDYFAERIFRYNPCRRKHLRVINESLMLVFLITISYQGFKLSIFQIPHESAALNFSMFWPYSAVPVSLLLMAFQCLWLLLCDIKGDTC